MHRHTVESKREFSWKTNASLPLSWPPGISHLLWKLELVVVVVGRQVDVFVDTVQQPEQELQSVMLRITPKLASIFGNYGLEREGEGGVVEEEEMWCEIIIYAAALFYWV